MFLDVDLRRLQRFFSKIEKTNNCWEWKGGKNKGYGKFFWNGKVGEAHRFSYELFKGEIPKGLQIDHLCRNPACMNPNHLEAVTQRENLLRGIGSAAINAQKTHCSRGHEFTLETTYFYNNYRHCKICAKITHSIQQKTPKAREYQHRYNEAKRLSKL